MHTLAGKRIARWLFLIFVAANYAQVSSAQTVSTRVIFDTQIRVTGHWESLQWNLDTWVLDLKSTKDTLTGAVSVIAGAGRPTGTANPLEIYDGKIETNRMEFKVKSPDGMRVIRFTGVLVRGEIRFTRSVELLQPGASPGIDDIFGLNAPGAFSAKRLLPMTKRASHIDP